jgi:hypothetical protein
MLGGIVKERFLILKRTMRERLLFQAVFRSSDGIEIAILRADINHAIGNSR